MRKGFTLIELLVVIAIIAILAAILFPVFLQVKDAAKTSKCLAHGRELGQATLMYMSDNGDRFPSALPTSAVDELTQKVHNVYDWPGTPTEDESNRLWGMGLAQYKYVQLKPYVKNDQIWICPNPAGYYGMRYAFGYLCSWLPRGQDNNGKGFVDGDRGFQDDSVDPAVGRTTGEVEMLDAKGETICGPRRMPPTKKIMWMCYGFGRYGRTIISPGPSWLPGVFPDYPHNGGSTFVYVDGHAACRKMGQAWAPLGYTKLAIDQTQ